MNHIPLNYCWGWLACAALVMLISVTDVLAAPTLDLGSGGGKPGSTVTIPVTLTNAPGVSLSAAALDVAYDATRLENPTAAIVTAPGKVLVSNSPVAGIFRIGVYGSNTTLTGNGTVISISFTIKNSAPGGDVLLGNTPSGSAPDGNPVSMTGANGKITVILPTISVTLAGTGGGTVNSSPAGIACSSGTCSGSFLKNTPVTLMAAPGTSATFGGWGGGCINESGNCYVVVDSDRSVTASFASAGVEKVRIGQTGYPTLNAAYTAAAATGLTTIQMLEGVLPESLISSKEITLKGGYNPTYSGVTGRSVVDGTLFIRGGKMSVDGVAVR